MRVPWPSLVAISALCSCAGSHAPATAVQNPVRDVSNRITVAEDATIFTLFAMLNAAGYDLENRETMHPVRIAIRADLARRLPPELRARIWEQLAAYERTREDLRSFYPRMLKALDPNSVLATWRQDRRASR